MTGDLCSIVGCSGLAWARGWCSAHYVRWRKGKEMDTPIKKGSGAPVCAIAGCSGKSVSRGWCATHYRRWRVGADMNAPVRKFNRKAEFDRLLVIETDECVEWPYATSPESYGKITLDGKTRHTHRLALVMWTGIDPAHLVAAHGPCHNPRCMNVRHLSWKTVQGNQEDTIRDGTRVCGERSQSAKLTEADVREIIASEDSRRSIAGQYGISAHCVWQLQTGRSWKHVWRDSV